MSVMQSALMTRINILPSLTVTDWILGHISSPQCFEAFTAAGRPSHRWTFTPWIHSVAASEGTLTNVYNHQEQIVHLCSCRSQEGDTVVCLLLSSVSLTFTILSCLINADVFIKHVLSSLSGQHLTWIQHYFPSKMYLLIFKRKKKRRNLLIRPRSTRWRSYGNQRAAVYGWESAENHLISVCLP